MPQREKITFEPNLPVTVTLAYPQGKIVSGRFGEQVMLGTADGRVMFLDLAVAQKVNLLEPQAGESITICKRTSKDWAVWLTPDTERMRAAKRPGPVPVNARATAEDSRPSAAPATVQNHQNSNSSSHSNPLIDEANSLVDAYAAVLERALTKYEGRVKPDEIKSIVLSCYIQQSKGAKYAA